ncbi:Restriction endonuclease [Candidatus Hepatincola sp. Pdp]
MSKKLVFHFNSNLQYQTHAVNSIVSLFTNSYDTKQTHQLYDLDKEVSANNLEFDNCILLENIQNIQKENKLSKSEELTDHYFTVEMETGTGKTYVYLKTIFELYNKFNLTKFIIVVPSIAIREGVLKTLDITKEHFKNLYGNPNFNYYLYDKNKVRDFATNNTLQIMVINVQSFDKESNKINQSDEAFLGMKPIEYIKDTNPIIILDEPQSASSTDKQKDAIKTLNPLCQIAYSATHKEVINLVYRLNAIDAYQQKLVKSIQVHSITTEDSEDFNLKLKSTSNANNKITAKVELLDKSGKSIPVTIKHNDDLYVKSKYNPIYKNGFQVIAINCSNEPFIEFSNGTKLTTFNPDDNKLYEDQKAQIYATVYEHFKKQKQLKDKNIKVLSLFFIDKVANYKVKGQKSGKFAAMFEKAFKEISNKKEFQDVIPFSASGVHNGYFSVEQGTDKDTKGNTTLDKETYSLIMKDKEKLLSFNEPISFLFSHSALKEGWDNPNVFQICTLNETKSVMKKRQEIGRGLRLCVNSEGERLDDENINQLTVITNSSYDRFAKELQKELTDEGLQFGTIEYANFLTIATVTTHEKAEEIFNSLMSNGYLDKKGNILDKFNPADKNFDLVIEDKFKDIKLAICDVLSSYVVKDRFIKNSKAKVSFNYNKDLSPYFAEIWNKIKHKTIYKVNFNNKDFEENCIKAIDGLEALKKPTATLNQADLGFTEAGVEPTVFSTKSFNINNNFFYCYNFVEELQKSTGITRESIINILLKLNNLESFFNQPRKYINMLTQTINKEKSAIMLEGLKYEKTDEVYKCEITDNKQTTIELSNYYEIKNSNKSVANYVDTDSGVENTFAKELDNSDDVLFFFKIPKEFKISTPLGNYSPDWAIIKNDNNDDTIPTLYFIVETKGTIDPNQLRFNENAKIKCGKKHFSALNTNISFKVTTKLKDL